MLTATAQSQLTDHIPDILAESKAHAEDLLGPIKAGRIKKVIIYTRRDELVAWRAFPDSPYVTVRSIYGKVSMEMNLLERSDADVIFYQVSRSRGFVFVYNEIHSEWEYEGRTA